MSQAESAYTASQAAAEIHALMNTRPTLPHRHEIEAIIGKVQAPAAASPLLCFNADRAKWRELVDAHDAAHAISGEMTDITPEAQAVSDAADAALAAFQEQIWLRPARGLADVSLFAEIAFREFWPGLDLTQPDAMERMEGGPHCSDADSHDVALQSLLLAIKDVLLRPVPANDTAFTQAVRSTIATHAEQERRTLAAADVDSDAWRTAVRECRACWDTLTEMQALIPSPPRTALQLLLHAEIAWYAADKDEDGVTLSGMDSDCIIESSSARLIHAAMAFLGGQPLIEE